MFMFLPDFGIPSPPMSESSVTVRMCFEDILVNLIFLLSIEGLGRQGNDEEADEWEEMQSEGKGA